MSSSPTETPGRRHDAPDGRLGRRGHRRRVEEAARRLGRGRRDHRLDLDRQDRHRRRGARERARAGDPRRGRHDGRRRRRDGAHRHRREAGRGARVGASATGGTSEAEVAMEAPGEAGELSGDTTETHAGTAQRGTPEVRRSGPRRYSPVVMRIAAEHGIDLEQVQGHRPRRPRAQARRARLPRGRQRRARRKSRRCTSRARTSPSRSPPRRRPRRRRRRAPTGQGEPLSRMRQSIGRAMIDSLQTAATCTTIIEADLTRIAADREKTGLTWLPYIARATIETLGDFPSLNATLEGETFTEYDGGQPRHRGLARHGRPDRPGHPRRAGPQRRGARPRRSRRSRARRATTSSRPTTSAAARSRSPTPAATARSWRRR